MAGRNRQFGKADDHEGDAVRHSPVFISKGVGANVFLTAAAAVVPFFIVGVAGLTSLTSRRGKTRTVRLPWR